MELAEALQLKQGKILQNLTLSPAKKRRKEREDETIDLILNTDLSFVEIARKVGITRPTVYAYWKKWLETKEAIELNRQWHRAVRTANKERKLEALTRIKIRMMPQKIEAKEEITSHHEIDIDVREYTAAVETAINYIASKKNPTEPLDTTQTTP